MMLTRTIRRPARFVILLSASLVALLALAACSSTNQPDSPPNAPPADNGDISNSSEDEKKDEDLIVTIGRLPSRVCIGQRYEVDILWIGPDLELGNIEWSLSYGNTTYGADSTLNYIHTEWYTMDNKVTKEAVKAQVEINGYTEEGADPLDLVPLTPLVGTAEQVTEFVYCEYMLNLSYSGNYKNEIFDVTETLDNTGEKGISITVDPATGKVTGEGDLDLSVKQTFSQSGVTCTVHWAGLVPVEVKGSIGSPGEQGTVALQVARSDKSVIDASTMECSGNFSASVPAMGGSVNLSALGVGNLDLPLTGGQVTMPVSSPVGPTSGSGSGSVTVSLTPKTGD